MTTVRIMGFVCLLCLFQTWLLVAVVRGTPVLWYRTAQNTPERLSPQTPLNFTADFPFAAEVQVDRCIASSWPSSTVDLWTDGSDCFVIVIGGRRVSAW